MQEKTLHRCLYFFSVIFIVAIMIVAWFVVFGASKVKTHGVMDDKSKSEIYQAVFIRGYLIKNKMVYMHVLKNGSVDICLVSRIGNKPFYLYAKNKNKRWKISEPVDVSIN